MNAVTWSWRYEDARGSVLEDPASEVFTSRGDAESWLGEHWPSLAAAGVRRAQLLSGATAIGRPVALRDPGELSAS